MASFYSAIFNVVVLVLHQKSLVNVRFSEQDAELIIHETFNMFLLGFQDVWTMNYAIG